MVVRSPVLAPVSSFQPAGARSGIGEIKLQSEYLTPLMKRSTLLVFLPLGVLGTWAVLQLQVGSKGPTTEVPPAVVSETRAVHLQPRSDQAGDVSARSPIPGNDMQEASGVAPADPQAPEPSSVVGRADDPVSQDSQWALEFAGRTAAELRKAADATEAEFRSMESDAATERHDLGIYDVVPSGKIRSGDTDSRERAVYQLGTGNELHRVVLPEADFPALYAMKRKAEWLHVQAVIASAPGRK